MSQSLPTLPPNGSLTQEFLSWEDSIIDTMKLNASHPIVWAAWQSARGLCITRKEHRLPHFAKAQADLTAKGHELATRRSGGTVVAQGDGILNITQLSLHTGPRNIGGSYMRFCENMQARFKALGFETEIGPVTGSYCDGDYNLILDGKKLAGTSQRWVKGPDKAFITLNHAVILVTENGQAATQRVNDFHAIADGPDLAKPPYDTASSISLWDSVQNSTGLDKPVFFERVYQSLKT